MSETWLSNGAARRLFLACQGLGQPPSGPVAKADLLTLVEALGYVQVDSINTVARAHDMILRARRSGYRPTQLRRLLERDRALFEHWTHDAAVIPTRFFPYWGLRFARDRERLAERWRRWQGDGFVAELAAVLEHVRANGPALAREVGDGPARPAGGWWDWRPAKTALEYHWRTGTLAVARRDGFQKVFDLTERVIPDRYRTAAPSDAVTIDWACAAALDRLGFATSGEIAAFWRTATPAEAASWCAARAKSGEIVEVLVESAGGRPPRRVYTRPEMLERAAFLPPAPSRIRVLSPFDPVLRDRARTERLFGFHYRIEVFTPEAKRRYGYYVFPLLEGERLVGRIDMRARRDADALVVRALWPEVGERIGPRRLARLAAELDRVARFAGCARVAFEDGWLREPQVG